MPSTRERHMVSARRRAVRCLRDEVALIVCGVFGSIDYLTVSRYDKYYIHR